MKYVRDKTGRFPQRPHYETRELDEECERTITGFMRERERGVVFPVPTDMLTKLIEQDAADLDLYADLSGEGSGVEGVTDFFPGSRPKVRISATLSEANSENRLRTTLTHEWGHVRFHDLLWQIETINPSMHSKLAEPPCPKCKRYNMFNAPEVDWMEWQAGYVCGAVLMPISQLRAICGAFCDENKLLPPLTEGSPSVLE